jgi:hypothetical protein
MIKSGAIRLGNGSIGKKRKFMLETAVIAIQTPQKSGVKNI